VAPRWRARTPEGRIVALARVDSLVVAGGRFTIAGGVPFGVEALTRLAPILSSPSSSPFPAPHHVARGGESVREVTLPFLDLESAGAPVGTATLRMVQSGATVTALRRSLDAWFAAALAGAAALGLGVAAWLAARVSRPLRDLAERTESIDLDRLDQDFASDRDDEIGALSRLLGAMTGRLRAGAARLREAERRVAMGDLARQVNHDIKNGLVPIRTSCATSTRSRDAGDPRRGVRRAADTLSRASPISMMLARNYARLTPPPGGRRATSTRWSRRWSGRSRPDGPRCGPWLPGGTDPAPVVLRHREPGRHAVDSVAGTGGTVEVFTEAGRQDGGAPAAVTIADSGSGMSRAELTGHRRLLHHQGRWNWLWPRSCDGWCSTWRRVGGHPARRGYPGDRGAGAGRSGGG
jgi:HAMP domain-containing protein